MEGEPIGGDWARQALSRQFIARLAGAAYIITIIAGIFAEAYVRGGLRVPGDAAATAGSIAAHPTLYSAGILADLIMLAAYLVVTATLYQLFKPTSRLLSLAAAFFSLAGIAMLAAALTLLTAPLLLLGQPAYQHILPSPNQEALAYLSVQLHGRAYGLSGFFFGLYCMGIGRLAVRSRQLPATIGWLMGLAGAAFLLDATLRLVAPALRASVPDVVMLISLVGEGSLALWLTFKGLSQPHASRGSA